MTSRVTYTGDLRTEAVHLRSGTTIITDAPIDNRGKGEAFSPTDLVATALAACILTLMGIKARDCDIDMEGAVAEVQKIMSSAPRRIECIVIRIAMPDRDYSEQDRQLLTDAANGCPVCRSLSEQLEVDLKIKW